MTYRLFVCLLAAMLLAAATGCTPSPGDTPAVLPLDWEITGTISSPGEVNEFALGRLPAGAQLQVEVIKTSGDLDPMVAVFNDDQTLWAQNDDFDLEARIYDSRMEGPIYHADSYTVAVTASTAISPTSGDYLLRVRITEGTLPEPQGQTVFLDFDGAIVRNFPGFSRLGLEAFDAMQLGFESDLTAQIIVTIVEAMERDYAGLDVRFVTSAEGPPEGPFTRIIFGGGEDGLFGVADEIDSFNTDLENTVLVFVESFKGISADVDETAQAIANVASHELGHALGLWHVNSDSLLMDDVTPTDGLLEDQSFGRGTLVDFPFGIQDAMALLTDWLGPLYENSKYETRNTK